MSERGYAFVLHIQPNRISATYFVEGTSTSPKIGISVQLKTNTIVQVPSTRRLVNHYPISVYYAPQSLHATHRDTNVEIFPVVTN